MRLVSIFLLCSLAMHALGSDVMGNLVVEALRVKNILEKSSKNGGGHHSGKSNKHNRHSRHKENAFDKIGELEESFFDDDKSSDNKGLRKKSHKSDVSHHQIPVEDFFPVDVIKSALISPDGSKVAYIARNNGLDSIHIIPTVGKSNFSNVITDNVHIKYMRFVGESIVYTCVDENNKMQIKSVDLKSKNRKIISPINDAKSIRVIATGASSVIVLSYNGTNYFTHKIDVTNGSAKQIKKDVFPLVALFDENLTPMLWYKNISAQSADVFVNDGTKGGRQIDQIDPKKEKYIFASEKCCYKLSSREKGVAIVSLKFDSGEQHETEVTGVELSDCKVLFDAHGNLQIAEIDKSRKTNVALGGSAQRSIDHLNNKFNNCDWSVVDSTTDKSGWLICVTNPRESNKYYYYDIRNMSTTHIATTHNSFPKKKLRSTECVKIQRRDGSFIRGYLTKGVEHSKDSPLVIMVRHGRYNWEFTPLAQLLANRGYTVLCLNCRTGDQNSSDIITATKWCSREKIVSEGKATIIAHSRSVLAAVESFCKHKNLFTGCALLSPIFPEERDPVEIQKIIGGINKHFLVVNSIKNAGCLKDSNTRETIKHNPATYLEYDKKPNNVSAVLVVEIFLSNIYGNNRCKEDSSRISHDFSVVVDNLNVMKSKGASEHVNLDESVSNYDML